MKFSRTIWFLLAVAAIVQAVSAAGQTAEASAIALFDEGRYTEAQVLLKSEIPQSDKQAPLYYWLGRCSFELNDDDGAVSNAEHAVQLDPGNSEYHLFLGVSAGHKAQFANWFSGLSLARKAEHEFLEAVRLNPRNLTAERDLISYEIAAPGIAGGGEEKAEDQITKLAAMDPVQAHLARMELYRARKDWSTAEQEANSVLAAKPKETDPYLEVASYYESREDAAGMRAALAAIPRSAVSDPHVDYYRGVADLLAGDHPEQAESLLKAYFHFPPPRREDRAPLSAAHTWLGRLYEKLGRRPSAADEYRAALELDSKDKAARDGLKRTVN